MTNAEIPANPYVGLRPFETADSAFYFGRDAETLALLRILHHHRFLPVVGSSGSGKSSLVKAGLIARLHEGYQVGARANWRIAAMRPGISPLRNLAVALTSAFGTENDSVAVDVLERDLRVGNTDALVAYLSARLSPTESVLLLVDQFEELFAFRGEDAAEDEEITPAERRARSRNRAEASAFVDILLGMASAKQQPLYVAITMRSDFLGDADLFYGLPEAMNRGRYLVPRMSRAELGEAIEGPAKLVGTRVSPRLLDQLRNEVGNRFDRLPMLQHVLQRTFSAWIDDGRPPAIDIAHYEAASTIERALDADAELALAQANDGRMDPLPLDLVERVFKALTDTDVLRRRIRNPVRASELESVTETSSENVMRVVGRFAASPRNFLVLRADESAEDPRIDITHECLIRQWKRLGAWVDDERDRRNTYLDLAKRAYPPREGLEPLRGPELALGQAWRNQPGISSAWARRYTPNDDVFATTARYVDWSVARARRRRLAWRLGAGTVVVASVLAVLWMNAANRAATDALLVSVARSVVRSDPTSAVLVLKELSRYSQEIPGADNAVMEIAAMPFAAEVLHDVSSIDVSADGTRIAYAQDSVVFVGSMSGARVAIRETGRDFRQVSLDQRGARLLTVSSGGIARLWSTADGHQICALAKIGARGWPIGRIAFSPDRAQIVAVTMDSTVRVWSASTCRIARTLGEPGKQLVTVLSRDGARAVTGSASGSVSIWDAHSGALVRTLAIPGQLQHVDISDDGTLVAASASDTMSVWDAATGRTLSRAPLGEQVVGAGFRPGSHETFIGGPDRIERRRPESIGYLGFARRFGMRSVRFDADGSMLLATTADHHVVGWTPCSRSSAGTRREKACSEHLDFQLSHASEIADIATGAGGIIVTRTVDGEARIWPGQRSLTTRHIQLDEASTQDARVTQSWRSGAVAGYVGLDGTAGAVALEVRFADDTVPVERTQRLWRAELGPSFANDARVVLNDSGTAMAVFIDHCDTARVWPNVRSAYSVSLGGHGDGVRALLFAADGSVVTHSMDGFVRLWNGANGSAIRTLLAPGRGGLHASVIARSANGATIGIGRSDGVVELRNLDGTEFAATLKVADTSIRLLAVDHETTSFAVVSSTNDIAVWDFQTGKLRALLSGHAGAVTSIQFGKPGELLSTSEDKSAILWDIKSKHPRLEFSADNNAVVDAEFNKARTLVVTTTANGSVHVWQTRSAGDPLVTLTTTAGSRATFSSSEDAILTLPNGDGQALYTNVSAEGLQTLLYDVQGCLTAAFRQRYIGESAGTARNRARRCERALPANRANRIRQR